MSVRRRAIQERRDRDGMRRAEYEQTMRWLSNVRELVRKKLMFDDQRVSAEELAACFEDADRPTETVSADSAPLDMVPAPDGSRVLCVADSASVNHSRQKPTDLSRMADTGEKHGSNN